MSIETNLEHNYIKELVDIIKNTQPLYNKELQTRPSRLKVVYKFIKQKFNLTQKVVNLSKFSAEQRTKEWYEFRENNYSSGCKYY